MPLIQVLIGHFLSWELREDFCQVLIFTLLHLRDTVGEVVNFCFLIVLSKLDKYPKYLSFETTIIFSVFFQNLAS